MQDKQIQKHWNSATDKFVVAAYREANFWLRHCGNEPKLKPLINKCNYRLDNYINRQMKRRGLGNG